MWWSRLALSLAPALLVAACGFAPVYAPSLAGVDVAARYGEVRIENIPDRSGQHLRNALIDRLHRNGMPSDARYSLRMVNLKERTFSLGVRKDATATRGQMDISTILVLTDHASGARVLQRELRGSGGYNILDSQYATIVAEQTVREQILDDIADSAVTALNLYFLQAR